ncbi:pentapeptide repeat-containing protein [Yersinia massiliensis]|uniref:pentapeptide repeat-containing protein n=1 Tax=Yersinia massiliensis TaxID=419257 RepID=UPI0005E218FE|nr:pentapeptide repeat-containing protein [Yersinia massiliensis]CNH98509.1 pentapeptide repeat-containing protein [Yersinia massiliensis]
MTNNVSSSSTLNIGYAAGIGSFDAIKEAASPKGILEHIINILTFGGVRRGNESLYREVMEKMVEALKIADKEKLANITINDINGCEVSFIMPEIDSDNVTVEVRKGNYTESSKINLQTYKDVCRTLKLRDELQLPQNPVILTDDGKINLAGADLSNVDLRRFDLSRADLVGADLRGAKLASVNLSQTNLSQANLSSADLVGSDLKGANLFQATLFRADLENAKLIGANLSQATLFRANLTKANLSEANLTSTELYNADLKNAYLIDANLTYADLKSADLKSADLTNANLTCANFTSANLTDAKLAKADLTCSTFAYATMIKIDMNGVKMPGANLTGAITFGPI